MNKRINIPWAVGLIVGVTVFGICVHFLHAYQNVRHADFFLERARSAAQEVETRSEALGDPKESQDPEATEGVMEAFEEAIGFYTRYIALQPDDIDGLAEYGMFLAEYDPQSAYMTLERVLREDGAQSDARRKAAETAVAIGRYRDAREHLEGHLLKATPDDAELLDLLAACQIAAGEYRVASDTLEKATNVEPDRLGLYVRRAVILSTELEQPEAADECMQELVDANPDSAEAHVLRGRYLRGVQKLEEASAEAAKAMELEPENVDAIVLAMECAFAEEDFDSAQKHAKQVLTMAPSRFESYRILSEIELGSGNPDEAVSHLRKGVEATSQNLYLVLQLTDLLIAQGDLEQAESYYSVFESSGAPDSLRSYLEGRLEFARRNWTAARDAFEVARPALPAGSPISQTKVDYWLGRCYRRLGDVENERNVTQRAASGSPGWLPARISRAEALTAAGDVKGALQEYGEITKLEDAPLSAWLALVRLMIVDSLRDDEADRDWGTVEAVLKHLEQGWPDDDRVLLARAQLLLSQGNATDAIAVVTNAAAEDRESESLQFGLAVLLENQEKWDEANAVYSRIESLSGDSVALRLARARHEIKRRGSDAAAVLPEFAENVTDFSDAQRLALWSGLAREAGRVGSRDFAKQLLIRVAGGSPTDLQVRLRLLEMAFEDQEDDLVEKCLKEIGSIEGKGPYWHYGEARRLASLAQRRESRELLDRAQQHAGEVQTMRPGWHVGAKLAAMISRMRGEDTAAIESLYTALERGDQDPATLRSLTELLYKLGRYEEAYRALQRFEDRVLLSGDFGKLAAQVALQTGDFEGAVKFAREATKASKNAADQLWLGQVLMIAAAKGPSGQEADQARAVLAEAEAALRKAVELDGSSSEPWLQLMRFLISDGQSKAAEALVNEVRDSEACADDPTLLGLCYEALGWDERAKEAFTNASRKDRDDPAVVRQLVGYHLRQGNLDEAENALKRLINGSLEVPVEEQMWARRALATLLDQRENRGEASEKALELIEENLAIAPQSVPDLRTKGYILASSAVPAQRESAIAILEGLLDESGGTEAQDRFQLAKLFARQDEPQKAMEQMRLLVAGNEDSTEYLAFHIALLLENDELNEAELWLKQLEKRAPGKLGTVILRSEMLFAGNQFEATRDLLVNIAGEIDVRSSDGGSQILRIARVLEGFDDRLAEADRNGTAVSFLDDAEKLYRRYCAQHSEERLVLASFLARGGRHKEAVQVLEESWETSPVEAVAFACDPLVRDDRIETDELERVEAVLRSCLKKAPNHQLALMVLAELSITQKDYDKAEEIYEGMLERNGQRLSAINNLAMLRALRGHKLDESLTSVSDAIDMYGSVPHLLDTRAVVYLARGDARKALVDLKVAGTKQPSASHYFHLAQTYLKLGEDESAAEALEKATGLGLSSGNLIELHQLEREKYEELRRALN